MDLDAWTEETGSNLGEGGSDMSPPCLHKSAVVAVCRFRCFLCEAFCGRRTILDAWGLI